MLCPDQGVLTEQTQGSSWHRCAAHLKTLTPPWLDQQCSVLSPLRRTPAELSFSEHSPDYLYFLLRSLMLGTIPSTFLLLRILVIIHLKLEKSFENRFVSLVDQCFEFLISQLPATLVSTGQLKVPYLALAPIQWPVLP
jgi:hypothetical protein